MKTRQDVLNEYLNRQANKKYQIEMEKDIGCGKTELWQYVNVTNIYKDGKKIDIPEQDEEFHKYEFDSGERVSIFETGWPLKWTNYNLKGKIIEFSSVIF
jgi:hypothetical protein